MAKGKSKGLEGTTLDWLKIYWRAPVEDQPAI